MYLISQLVKQFIVPDPIIQWSDYMQDYNTPDIAGLALSVKCNFLIACKQLTQTHNALSQSSINFSA